MKKGAGVLVFLWMGVGVWGQAFFPLGKNGFWAYTSLIPNKSDSYNSVTGDTVINGKKYSVLANAGFPYSWAKYVRGDSNIVYRVASNSELILFDLNKNSAFNSPSNMDCHWRYVSDTIETVFGLSDSSKTFVYTGRCLDGAGSLTLSKKFGMIRYQFSLEGGSFSNFILRGAIISGTSYGNPSAVFAWGNTKRRNQRVYLRSGHFYFIQHGETIFSLLGQKVVGDGLGILPR